MASLPLSSLCGSSQGNNLTSKKRKTTDQAAKTSDNEKKSADEKHPPSFSLIEDPYNPDYERFPLFKGVPTHKIVVKAGESLFLPAGWFHHVTSRGGLHMAVNYWFHPPPYPDALHEEEFAEKVAAMKKALA